MDSITITKTNNTDEHFTEIKITGSSDEKEVTRFVEDWCETHNFFLTEINPVEDHFIARVCSDDFL
jgi:hypothetical protein